MGKKRVTRPPQRQSGWRGMALGGFVLVAAIAGAVWWFSQAQDAASGTPRLKVDRTEVDLGYLRYDTPAVVVFSLANVGDGALKLLGAPPVKLLKGC